MVYLCFQWCNYVLLSVKNTFNNKMYVELICFIVKLLVEIATFIIAYAFSAATVDLFGSTPFNPVPPTTQTTTPPRLAAPQSVSNPFKANPVTENDDPFGMGSFSPPTSQEIDQQIQNVDRELMDLQV